MGYDAFGLPAENHAIKTGQHPRESTEEVDRGVPAPFHEWGISIDWDRELGHPRARATTAGPSGSFLQLFERGPGLPPGRRGQLVPERPDRAGQRAGDRRPLRALRHAGRGPRSSSSGSSGSPTTPTACSTTCDTVDWPEHVMTMQRNWIGRSEGAEVVLPLRAAGHRLPASSRPAPTRCSARPSSCMAPEHPDVLKLAGDDPEVARVRQPRADRVGRGARRTRRARRPACRWTAPSPTR